MCVGVGVCVSACAYDLCAFCFEILYLIAVSHGPTATLPNELQMQQNCAYATCVISNCFGNGCRIRFLYIILHSANAHAELV